MSRADDEKRKCDDGYPVIAIREWNVCVLPHSRQRKWTESRRDQGFGVSQTVHSVSWGRTARSQ